jgi:hypothetical protein
MDTVLLLVAALLNLGIQGHTMIQLSGQKKYLDPLFVAKTMLALMMAITLFMVLARHPLAIVVLTMCYFVGDIVISAINWHHANTEIRGQLINAGRVASWVGWFLMTLAVTGEEGRILAIAGAALIQFTIWDLASMVLLVPAPERTWRHVRMHGSILLTALTTLATVAAALAHVWNR